MTSDGTPGAGDGGGLTRRGLLAAAGTVAVAGCSAVGDIGAGGEPTIRAYDLPDVDVDSIPEPVVAPSVPARVAPAHFAGARERATDLLATLPTPLEPADVPNGYVRRELTDAADAATDALDDARSARTHLLALDALRDAREEARYAAVGWAVADGGLSTESLRAERRRVASEARSTRSAHEYLGADPVAAALVHARVEDWLSRATGVEDPRNDGDGRLLTAAEWGATAETARAHLDDARHLRDRFASSLPADAGTVEERLRRAAESLLADVRARRGELPPEPTAEDWGLAEYVVAELRRAADSGPSDVADADGPASAVVDLTGRLAAFGALDRVRERVDAEELSGVESAEAVREDRTAAYDALDAALTDSPAPGLARTVLSDVSWRVSTADRNLTRYRGEVSPAQLDDVVEGYAVATAVARATPTACRRTVDALGSV